MNKRRIHSKGDYRYEEFVAGEAGIYPGMLLYVFAGGTVKMHASDSAITEKLFALEDALQGKSVADVYAIGSIVPCIIPAVGSVVNALITAGQDIAIGDKVVSDGNGCLKEGSTVVLGIAEEVLDLTDSGDSNDLCPIRIV